VSQGLDVNLFYIGFFSYLTGFAAYSLYAAFRKAPFAGLGFLAMLLGLALHTAGFVFRWRLAGHIPLTNMYEYLSVMSWMVVLMLLIIHRRYRKPFIGALLSPVVFMLTVATALLPKDVNQSLMPALQSVWLHIHVSLAALGSGCFLIAFGISALYLLRGFNPRELNPSTRRRSTRLLFITLTAFPPALTALSAAAGRLPPTPDSYIGSLTEGVNLGGCFTLTGIGFILGLIAVSFLWRSPKYSCADGWGGWLFVMIVFFLLVAGLTVGGLIRSGLVGITHNLHPGHGESSRSAWLIFEFIGLTYAVALIPGWLGIPALFRLFRSLPEVDSNALRSLDQLSYMVITLGYPLYTIGALFAGAIWAEKAWGAFWSWDPKEVGALIVWLFYSGYLHARRQRGWMGAPSAILVIAGFIMVVISFFGNYFFGGLHAYA